ncbi:hypothetical protein [Pseudomonas syringae]|uniref:hypothetical protein n=2 Tax=Pseudomonas syringae group TaxID=136849 RepID=UPI001E59F93C|nr:hypothetical protein [Pseudomonas syringae]
MTAHDGFLIVGHQSLLRAKSFNDEAQSPPEERLTTFNSVIPWVIFNCLHKEKYMATRCVALAVVANEVTVVDTTIPDDPEAPITLIGDETWKLPSGDRSKAYDTIFHRCKDFLAGHQVDQVVIKGSALSQGTAKMSLLEGAELRGIIMCAAASTCETRVLKKDVISRTYGRKVDDCVKDDAFWDEHLEGANLRKGSREAAMLIVAHRARP